MLFRSWNPSDTLDYDPTNPYRSKRAFFALPSSNEWYKAAYYDPNKGSGGYWDYATGSDTPPISVTGGTLAGSSVYRLFYAQGPAVVTQAAGLSPYGIMGMNGNVAEWEETASDLVNDSPSETRGFRGGAWFDGDPYLSSSFRNCALPEFEHEMIGFRVWSQDPPNGAVPEPTSIAIGSLFGLGTYLARKRKRREM